METFADRLAEALRNVPVVDPHTHLSEEHPHASTLADILLYHHVWIELVSSGMPAQAASRQALPHELAAPQMSPEERVLACLPYLPRIRNTVSMRFLRWIFEDLYAVPGGFLTDENWRDVSARVERSGADPRWGFEFLRSRCRIERSITVESARKADTSAPDSLMARAREVRSCITLDNAKTSPRHALKSIEAALNNSTEFRSGEEFGERLALHAQRLGESGLRYIGVWLPPYLRLSDPSAADVARVFDAVRRGGEIGREDQSVFTSFALRRLLETVRRTPVRTIQVIVGAEVLPPHRSISHWDGAFVGSIGRLAGVFEDLNLDVSAASDAFVHDLAMLAKHVPNVSVCGYWWHALYPPLVRKSIELRLDAVPAGKITAFFSDAYHAEWCYPKLKMVKAIFHDVLAERVARGWYDEETALSLVKPLFYDNPLRIYFGGPA